VPVGLRTTDNPVMPQQESTEYAAMSLIHPNPMSSASPESVPAMGALRRTAADTTGLRFAFLVWLAMRGLLSAWGALRLFLTPDSVYRDIQTHAPTVALPQHDLAGYLVGVWNIYDTPDYVKIAQEGFASDPAWLTALFPGYPLLIKVTGTVLGGQMLLAALLVANVATFFFFWYLYRLVLLDYSPSVARRAVLFSALFPTSFFLFLGYTEAPLLAFTVAAIYYARQQRWWAAGCLAVGAALVKQPGIFLLLPLAYLFWQAWRAPAPGAGRPALWAGLWLLPAPLAAGGYTLYRYFYLQTPSGGLTDVGASGFLTIPGTPLWRALSVLRPENPLLIVNVIDVVFTLLLIGLVAGVVIRLRDMTYTLYSGLLALVSLSLTWPDIWRPEVNLPRRLLIIFPIYIYLAATITRPRTLVWVGALSLTAFLILSGLFIVWVFIS
jgi:hypothetical protein